MSDNWVVQNLENALEVWNGKLSEIWQLINRFFVILGADILILQTVQQYTLHCF